MRRYSASYSSDSSCDTTENRRELEEMLAVLAQLPQPFGAELSERGAATLRMGGSDSVSTCGP